MSYVLSLGSGINADYTEYKILQDVVNASGNYLLPSDSYPNWCSC